MLNPNAIIKVALEGDPGLMSRVGTGNIYQAFPGDKIPPPFLVFGITENRPAFGADDAEFSSDITVTIDAVHRDNVQLTAIMLDLDRIMTSISYVRDSYGPLGQTAGAYTRMIRFKTEMEV